MWKRIAFLLLAPMLAHAQSYTTFPNLQSGNVNFTATVRANGSACSSGQAIVSGSGTVSCTTIVPATEKGAANGVATLDSGGLVPVSQLPFSGLSYEGSWNANTNSPTLADGVGTGGDFYITSVAGSQNLGSGSISFAVGDWALYNGSVWQKVPSSAAVTSVFGRTGAVAATAGDYTAADVTNVPAGGIAATNVQTALNELDTEKQAASSNLTSWAALTRASGFDTFTQTPSSANLRGLLTDETGTGLAYFQGGALGTPSSGTLTSATGLPWSTGLTGVPTTAVGYGITGGAKLDAYAGGDTPSAFTLGIVDSADAATWRSAIGAGTSSFSGNAADLTGTLADARLSSNVPLKNAANGFVTNQTFDLLNFNTNTPFVTGANISSGSNHLAIGTAGSGQLYLYTGGAQRGVLGSAGNWTLNAPSSGTTLAINGLATTAAVTVGSTGAASTLVTGWNIGLFGSFWNVFTQSTDPLVIGTAGAAEYRVATNSSTRYQINSTGNHTISAPSSGTSVTTNAAAGAWAHLIEGGNTSGTIGLIVDVGDDANEIPLLLRTSSEVNLFYVDSSGSALLGTPTGGAVGAGILNADVDLRIDNVSVCRSDGTNCPSGSGVSSITGTGNQVIASASTGAVTLSLPQSINTGASVQFGSFGVGTAASGTTGEIRATNNVTAYYSSDRRLKENVQAIPDALEKIEQIRGVTFDWTDGYIASHGGEDGYFIRKRDVGVIAQEVEAVLPEVVATREDGYKAVKYDRLVALLIESVKDLKAANDELYERVKTLEAGR